MQLGRSLRVRICGVIAVEDHVETSHPKGNTGLLALEQIANRPIIEHVVDALEEARVDDVLVVSSKATADAVRTCLDQARKLGGRPIRYLQPDSPVDFRAALTVAAGAVGGGSCVVHRASGLLDAPLAETVRFLGDAPTTVVIAHHASHDHKRLDAPTQEVLDLAQFTSDHLSKAGICLFGPGALAYAATSVLRSGGAIGLAMSGDAPHPTRARATLDVRIADGWHQYDGDLLDLLNLNRIVLDRLDSGTRQPNTEGNQIEGRVWIHEKASVCASVIVGPAVIGARARISDAYIGPYTSIGEGARVEGAEVERSIVCPGASVMHIGGRLVMSVVGRDARVFRDFSLPRALRLRVGAGTEVALS